MCKNQKKLPEDTDLEFPMGYGLAVCPSEDCHNRQAPRRNPPKRSDICLSRVWTLAASVLHVLDPPCELECR